MFSVQFPHSLSQAIVFFFLHTIFSFFLSVLFFVNAQGGNEKKAVERKAARNWFFFHFKRGQWTTQIFLNSYYNATHACERRRERAKSNFNFCKGIYLNPLRMRAYDRRNKNRIKEERDWHTLLLVAKNYSPIFIFFI